MNKKYELIYEGNAKKVFTHDDANKVKIEFKDEATAFNALKREKFEGKGKLNCLISARIFEILIKKNIPTHFIQLENENTMIAKKIKVIPLEIVLRNKGYTESFISSSNYFVDEQNNLHIKTIYKSTVSEERISFLSTHVRSRFSTIRNLENNSVIQTSHTSEIRNLASLKD